MNIEKLKPTTATTVILCVGNVFTVGLSFFLLSRQLFLSLDLIRLAAICIALSVAPISLGILLFGILFKRADNDEENYSTLVLTVSGMISVLMFNWFLFTSYIFHANLRQFYIQLSGFYIVFSLAVLLFRKKLRAFINE